MKKIKTLYWVFTGLFCAMMVLSSYSQIASAKDATAVMEALQLPLYLLPFLAISKLAGVIVLLIPVHIKLKEWAYAGFIFDFVGATYCMIAVGSKIDVWGFMIIPFIFWILSYVYYNKRNAI